MIWTADQDEHLRALWAAGHLGTEIGLTMRVTKNAVIGRVHRLGLPLRGSPIGKRGCMSPESAALKAAILTAYKTGETAQSIADRLGKSKGYVCNVACDAGLSRRAQEPKPRPAPSYVPPSVPMEFRPTLSKMKARQNAETAEIRARRPDAPAVKVANGCCWIEGEVLHHPHTDDNKCGAERVSGRAWCDSHMTRVFTKAQLAK